MTTGYGRRGAVGGIRLEYSAEIKGPEREYLERAIGALRQQGGKSTKFTQACGECPLEPD